MSRYGGTRRNGIGRNDHVTTPAREQTAFPARVLKADVPLGVDLLADILIHPTLLEGLIPLFTAVPPKSAPVVSTLAAAA